MEETLHRGQTGINEHPVYDKMFRIKQHWQSLCRHRHQW